MRNNVLDKAILVVGAMFVCVLMFIGAGFEHNYTRTAMVTDVQGDVVVCADESGNAWEFIGDGFKEGEWVKLKMYDNNTFEDVTDDIVKDVTR